MFDAGSGVIAVRLSTTSRSPRRQPDSSPVSSRRKAFLDRSVSIMDTGRLTLVSCSDTIDASLKPLAGTLMASKPNFSKPPGCSSDPTKPPAWLMETALEVEAGRLSVDQARARMEQRGLRIGEPVHAPVRSFKTFGAAIAARSVSWSDHIDPVIAWLALRPQVRERIGAAAIVTAVANLGADISIELTDPVAQRRYRAAESEALSLIYELVNVHILGGDDTTLPPRPDLRPLGIRQCRVCGCTGDHPCDGGCDWVETDLCSSCVTCASLHTTGSGEPR